MKSETYKTLPFYQLCGMIFAVGLAGCTTSGGDKDPSKDPAVAAAQARITATELTAYCPSVTIREGTAIFNNYGKAPKTPENLIYQASIANETRSCQNAGGNLGMNVAIAGKVVPGPKFTPGTLTMPIRVAVMQGSNVIYSKLYRQPISATDSNAASQFVFNDPNVSFPAPTAKDVQVFIGFDEGPDDTQATAKSKKKK
ncbi:hypothetical protein [Phyllobacterium myrsinacearum]|uniref:Lipoprotein n=1 Tax=Phyllobacterium myrsinacearum TaxID=28101 RepID=A0A839EAF4_9HYPH|nr:hypothetical protein [Phyllobacterium myrsinacearum]MBA8876873.1 hypothetical protein [Phyllobacterium myrsinacearum]